MHIYSAYNNNAQADTDNKTVPRALLAGIIVFLFAACQMAYAGQLDLKPSILERVTWNDNFFLKDFDDVELRTQPALNVSYSAERLKLGLISELHDFRYLDNSHYDRTNYSAAGNIGYQLTEKLSFDVRTSWLQDYSLDTYWDDDFDQLELMKRNTYTGSASAKYSLSELDSLDLSFSYSALDYTKKISRYSNYSMLNGSLLWQHILADGLAAFVTRASWQHITFDTPDAVVDYGIIYTSRTKQDMTQNVYSLMVGFNFMPSEQLTIQALAGLNRTKSESEVENSGIWLGTPYSSKVTNRKYRTGFTGSLDASWKGDNDIIRLIARQDYVPSSDGELRRTTRVNLSYNHIFSRKFNIYTSASYTNSKSEHAVTSKISEDFWYAMVQPSYRVTEDLTLRLQYSFSYKNDKDSDREQHANTVYLQFAYEFPMHF